jgi:transposase InsO family protein
VAANQIVGTDVLTIEKDAPKVLTMVDLFDRVVAFALIENETSAAVAQAFVRTWVHTYSWPMCVLSDNGAPFVGRPFVETLESGGVRQIRISAYHPRANGAAERANGLLLHVLRSLLIGNPRAQWPDLVSEAQYLLNVLPTTTNGLAPFYARFGTPPRIMRTLKPESKGPVMSVGERAQKVHERREYIEMLMREAMTKYRKDVGREEELAFVTGDFVWVRRRRPRTKVPKVEPLYEGPYVIVEVLGPTQFLVCRVGEKPRASTTTKAALQQLKRFRAALYPKDTSEDGDYAEPIDDDDDVIPIDGVVDEVWTSDRAFLNKEELLKRSAGGSYRDDRLNSPALLKRESAPTKVMSSGRVFDSRRMPERPALLERESTQLRIESTDRGFAPEDANAERSTSRPSPEKQVNEERDRAPSRQGTPQRLTRASLMEDTSNDVVNKGRGRKERNRRLPRYLDDYEVSTDFGNRSRN